MNYIYQTVTSLIETNCTSDPFELCELLGIVCSKTPYKKLKGLFVRINDFKFVDINDNLPEYQQKSVCAHELGHALLHAEQNGLVPMLDYDICGKSKLEYEANIFAAELLMPDQEILPLIKNGEDLYTVAKHFGVHDQFVLFKLLSMNQRGYRILLPDVIRSCFLGDE